MSESIISRNLSDSLFHINRVLPYEVTGRDRVMFDVVPIQGENQLLLRANIVLYKPRIEIWIDIPEENWEDDEWREELSGKGKRYLEKVIEKLEQYLEKSELK